MDSFYRRLFAADTQIYTINALAASDFLLKFDKNIRNMRQISTEKAPAAIGPYSQAIEHNGFIFVSGQLPIDPATGAFPEGGIEAQTRQSLTNLRSILEESGSNLRKVLKTTVFLADMNDFGAMNGIYSEFFGAPYPARCAFAVKTLPKGALVEIECIAAAE